MIFRPYGCPLGRLPWRSLCFLLHFWIAINEDRPKRTSDVSRFLAQNGIREARLVKGPGYFCFEGKATDDWIDHTVEVPFLGDLTYDQWLRTFRAMNDNPANRTSVRKAARG